MRAMHEDNAEKMMASYEAVVEYVLIQMGGFHIDGWHIKSPIES